MIRNVLGSVVALVGAAAAVQSPFHSWFDDRLGRDYRVQDLFNGISGVSSSVMGSILLPFLFAALVTLVGVVLRLRWVVVLAGLIVIGFTVLWMVRQGQEAGSLTVDGDGNGLGWGVAQALAGGLLLLLGALLMSGRRKRAARERYTADPYPVPPDDRPDTWPPTQEPGPAAQTSPAPEPERDPYTGPGRHRAAPADEDTAPYPVQHPEGQYQEDPYPDEGEPRDQGRYNPPHP
ncbi:hypothetical protein ACFTXO_00520 [Streptomyces sp. NPDC057067]|uniref:hypothetical protein n=1 Tax=Streptomyces TaxID=1883 RepID=UPI001921E6E3|nr:hypothetical protein [Streptomyces silvae]MBL1289328.1 hypothetical protein [Streptomyces silvae]